MSVESRPGPILARWRPLPTRRSRVEVAVVATLALVFGALGGVAVVLWVVPS